MLGFDFDLPGTETVRQTGQVFLEKRRSDTQHHAWQQGATPFQLASDIAGLALRYHPGRDVHFLEPCIGTGIFFSALLHDATGHDGTLNIRAAHGVEPDQQFAALAHDLWAPAGLTVHDIDFMRLSETDLPKATLVMSRPPATAHHHLTSEQKVLAADRAEEATGIRPTGLADLYIHFLLATHTFLAPDAVAAWLVPTAFLQHSAGQALRSYLTNHVRLQRIHNFDRGTLSPTDHQHEILDWSVIVFTNTTAQPTDTFTFSSGGELFGADTSVDVSYANLDPTASWTNLGEIGATTGQTTYVMEDFFWIRRGWDIPAPKFFVQPESRAWALGIQPSHMHPLLPPPEEITDKVVDDDGWGYPDVENRRVIITSRYDSYYLEDKDPGLLQYLRAANGDTRKATEAVAYGLWYNLHVPKASPILVQPATEEDTGPFRFVINKSQGVAGPGWIRMHPKLPFAQPHLILNGIDWHAVQYALEAIRLPDASKKPELTPSAVASLDATVIAEYLGITDQRA